MPYSDMEEQPNAVDELRRLLADGFSFVKSREVTASIATITFEESISAAIDEIQNDPSNIRPGKITSIRRLKSSLIDAVDQARRLPSSVFFNTSQSGANTTPEGQNAGEEE